MGYKSRGNYAQGIGISQENWDRMFPKEKKDGIESQEQCGDTNTEPSGVIQTESRPSTEQSVS